MKKLKKSRGITLIALVITIIILLILTGVAISQLTENGLFNKISESKLKATEAEAKEQMEFKLMEVKAYAVSEPDKSISMLQYIANRLCNDSDIEYVVTASKVASLNTVELGDATTIYVKLIKYLYEFEIDDDISIIETRKLSDDYTSIAVTNVVLPSTNTIKIGNKSSITAKILPENATYTSLTWSSTNTDIATVDQTGRVTGVSAGTCEIVATSTHGENGTEVVGRCTITLVSEYRIGDLISIKGQSFFVMKTESATDNVITLIKKDIDAANSWSEAKRLASNCANVLGINAVSRLMTYEEAVDLETSCPDLLFIKRKFSNGIDYNLYWLANEKNLEIGEVWAIGTTPWDEQSSIRGYRMSSAPKPGMRPVLEISTSLL